MSIKYKYEFEAPEYFKKGDCCACPLGYDEYDDMYADWNRLCVLGCNYEDCPLKADTGISPKIVEREYYPPKYYCPICGKEQKSTFKTRREGCYCERCGTKLEAFKCITEK